MASDAPQDVTVVGRRLRRRVLLALGLFGVLPVLVLAYAVHRYVFTDVTALRGVNLFGLQGLAFFTLLAMIGGADRKSTRLNSSHSQISYAVFCLKKKKKTPIIRYMARLVRMPNNLPSTMLPRPPYTHLTSWFRRTMSFLIHSPTILLISFYGVDCASISRRSFSSNGVRSVTTA